MKYGENYVGRKFLTEYKAGAQPDRRLVDPILEAGRRLNALGLTPENAGNISVRTKRGMLITSGGVNKGHMTAEDLVEVLDFDFERAEVAGGKEPSSETPMHWIIYRTFPLVNAVVHVHDDPAQIWAGKLKLTMGIHSTEGGLHYGTEEQAYQAAKALEHAQYAVIRGHGVVCMDRSLNEAVDTVVKIHEALLKWGDINRRS